VTLLGYVTYYTEGPGAAYPYLKRAAGLNPRSLVHPKLLGPASMVRPSAGSVPSPQQAAPPTSGDQPSQDKRRRRPRRGSRIAADKSSRGRNKDVCENPLVPSGCGLEALVFLQSTSAEGLKLREVVAQEDAQGVPVGHGGADATSRTTFQDL